MLTIEMMTIKKSIFVHCMIEKLCITSHYYNNHGQRFCFLKIRYKYYINFVSFSQIKQLSQVVPIFVSGKLKFPQHLISLSQRASC